MEEKKRDLVFLSYAHDDLDQVWKVYEGLKKRNVAIWFDKEDLGPGKWYPQIMKKIARSRYFIFCVSNAALRKTGDEKPGFVDKELQRAYEIAMSQPDDVFTIVPVRIEKLEDKERGDLRLSSYQQYDLFEDFEKELDRLAVNIGGISLADAKVKDERTEDEKLLDSLFSKAAIAYYSGDYKRALVLAESIIELDQKNHKAWSRKGAALCDSGKRKEAINAYDRAIEIKPDYRDAWYNKGIVLDHLGKYKEAIAAIDKAIVIKPDKQESWAIKGLALKHLGRDKEAKKAFAKAAELEMKTHVKEK